MRMNEMTLYIVRWLQQKVMAQTQKIVTHSSGFKKEFMKTLPHMMEQSRKSLNFIYRLLY